MKLRLAFAFSLGLSLALLPALAQACRPYDDPWLDEGKAKHFAGSAALGMVTSQLTDNTWTAFGLALAPGVARQIYDSHHPCVPFSWRDLSFDALGAYVGVRTGQWLISPAGVTWRKEF